MRLTWRIALQLARLSGFSPIIATASLRNTDLVKSLGATHIIDRGEVSLADLPAAVAKITSQCIKMVYSAVIIPEAQEAGYACLARSCGAKIASIQYLWYPRKTSQTSRR